MYAPFGAGVLIGPREAFSEGDPFLAGGGAVDLVDLDEVVWTEPPDREEAGSPNVVGAVALDAAIGTIGEIGWPAIIDHDRRLAARLRSGLASIKGVRLLGPGLETETLPVAAFIVEGVPHALVAARLSAEDAIGVRHGCFCAHPYLVRLLGLSKQDVAAYREEMLGGDRSKMPGAVRASAGLSTSDEDLENLLSGGRKDRRWRRFPGRLFPGPPHRGLQPRSRFRALAGRVQGPRVLVLAWLERRRSSQTSQVGTGGRFGVFICFGIAFSSGIG